MKKRLKCILLVDDDEATNFLNKRLLRKGAYANHIEVAENGQEALDFLKSASEELKPAIIFLDINMPVMNGWEFLDAYENIEVKKKAKAVIVMLTTSIRDEDHARANERGEVSAFISKPLNAGQLDTIIRGKFPELFQN